VQAGLLHDRVEVLLLDPIYLALLAGQGNYTNAENLFQMGPLFKAIASTCLSANCTPVLVHHTTKGAAKTRELLGLDDLAYSGVAEFARQWWLLSRREHYDPSTGLHRLWMSVGRFSRPRRGLRR
jgi:replicative DNA helicase